jgi:hypothetical protein
MHMHVTHEAVAQALALQGSFSEAEADALETSVLQLREKWR